MRPALRVLRRLLLVLLALTLAASAGVAGLLWWSLPPQALRTRLPGLSAEVHITLDRDGVPRIDAPTATDAAAALGFMHARDRMFQMELMRRTASGRLSELAGPATLRLDRMNRTLGLRRRATADLETLDAGTRALLDAYARGVNAWIGLRGRFAAPEFVVLGAPEPWTPVDSLLWGKIMGVWLSGNWRQELWRANLAARLDPAVLRALFPSGASTPRPDAALAGAVRLALAVPDFPEPFTLPSTASNEWAVDGANSATGAPLLAGDPHLALGFPGIWYLARIQTPQGVLAGATAPGIPFLVMGHNGRIAWTFTTTGADTQDVFIETPLDNGTYATPDGPQSFTVRAERIAVRGQPDDVFQVRETRHGPVLSDLDRVEGGPVLAVAMANLEPGDAATGLAALNRATTLDEAARAAAQITSPVQNLLVADRTRIAQFTTGRIPLRRAGDGTLPVPGADGAHDWTGFAQGAALPQVIDPPSGRLVNANERTAGPDFPVFMGQDWFSDWRARRIRQLLAAQPKHSLAGFAAMQADSGSSFATQILPRLLMVPSADAASAHVLAMLRNWDGGMRVDQPQPLLFNAWMRQFQVDVLRRIDLPDGAAGPMTDFVGQVLSPSGALLCGGDCTALLAGSLKTAVAGLEAQYGTGWDSVPWGQVHQAVFAHPLLGQIPGLAWLTTFRVAQAGDDSTVFRGSMRAPGWESVHGPGYRGVYDLAELDRSLFVVAPGQSGNPLRHTAASLLRRWRDGFPVQLGPQPNEITDTIGLRP